VITRNMQAVIIQNSRRYESIVCQRNEEFPQSIGLTQLFKIEYFEKSKSCNSANVQLTSKAARRSKVQIRKDRQLNCTAALSALQSDAEIVLDVDAKYAVQALHLQNRYN